MAFNAIMEHLQLHINDPNIISFKRDEYTQLFILYYGILALYRAQGRYICVICNFMSVRVNIYVYL